MKYTEIISVIDAMELDDLLEQLEYFTSAYRYNSTDYNRQMLEMYVVMTGIKLTVEKGYRSDLLAYDKIKDFVEPMVQNMKGSN